MFNDNKMWTMLQFVLLEWILLIIKMENLEGCYGLNCKYHL